MKKRLPLVFALLSSVAFAQGTQPVGPGINIGTTSASAPTPPGKARIWVKTSGPTLEYTDASNVDSSIAIITSGVLTVPTVQGSTAAAGNLALRATSSATDGVVNFYTSPSDLVMTVTQAADGFTGDSGLLFTSNIGFGTTLGLPTATSGNAGEYFYVQPGNGAAADASSDGQPSGGFHVSSGNGGAGCATCNSGGPRIPGDGGSVVLSGGNAGADGGSGLPAAGGLIALFGGAGTNGGLRGPIFIGTSSLVEIGFSGSPTQIDDTLHVIGASTFSGNAQFSGQIVGSLSFLKENNHQISVDSSTAANVAGGSLNIAAGTPTSGNANGGTLFLDAAYGIGAGVRGNISIGFGNGATASAANVSEYAHDLAQIVVNNVVVFTSDTSGTAINAPGATSLKIGLSTNNIGFFGASGTTQQTIQPLVNNVTVGGTTDTIDDFTSLTVYSVDAPAIRNDIYQLARKVQQLEAAMGPTSGYSLTKH